MALLQTTIEGIGIDPDNNPLVVLKVDELDAFVSIHVGQSEAVAIQRELKSLKSPLPVTHDLLVGSLTAFGIQFLRVTISRVVEGVFYAVLQMQDGSGRKVELDARPSDAIALALRAKVPIEVEEDVVSGAGILPI